jgi:glutaredoxin
MKTVRVFGASWCTNCKLLTKQLDQKKIEYKYVDIEAEPEMVKAYDLKSLPTTVVNDEDTYEVIIGNNIQYVLKALE